MSTPTDILAIFDTTAIAANYATPSQNPDAPTVISTDYIAIVSAPFEGTALQNTANIILSGTNLRIRTISLSIQADDTVFLYSVTPVQQDELNSTAVLKQNNYVATAIFPNGAELATPYSEVQAAACWLLTLSGKGKFPICIRVVIMNRDGTLQGYYAWSTDLTLSD